MADQHGLFWDSRGGDRKYNADSMEEWLKPFFVTGVFNGQLQVTATTGMGISVASGYCNVGGKVKLFDDATTFTLEAASAVLDRVDTVVIERNNTDRDITLKVVTGTPGEGATAPVRSDTIYQLVLAQISVRTGAVSISQADITDTRTNSSLCGYVCATVDEIDFDQIAAQFESWFNTYKTSATNSFLAWFNNLRYVLDGDVAGHLQNEIEDLGSNFAPVELTSIASQAYSVGEFLLYNGLFYKVIDTITEGDTLVIDTNIERTRVCNELSGGGIGSVVNLITTTESFKGKTVTVTGTYDTYTTVFDDTGRCHVNVQYVDHYTIECEGFYITVNVTAMGLVYLLTLDEDYKMLNITANCESMYGEMIKLIHHDSISGIDEIRAMVTFDPNNGTVEVRATQIGDYTLEWDDVTSELSSQIQSFEITELDQETQNITFCGTKLRKTFAAATDKEINSMVLAADEGMIDLYEDCGWRIGQEHQITLAAIASSGTYDEVNWSVDETQPEQSVILTLMDSEVYELVESVKKSDGTLRTRATFVVGLKDVMAAEGRIDEEGSSHTYSWTTCWRRYWCNGGLRQAIPDVLKPIFKKIKVPNTKDYAHRNTLEITEDYFAMFAEYEVAGAISQSCDTASNYSFIDYYQTSSNRQKSYRWVLRSPTRANTWGACYVSTDGGVGYNGGPGHAGNYSVYKFSPFGCI